MLPLVCNRLSFDTSLWSNYPTLFLFIQGVQALAIENRAKMNGSTLFCCQSCSHLSRCGKKCLKNEEDRKNYGFHHAFDCDDFRFGM